MSEEMLASIDRHFVAGCGFIDAVQFRAHKATGSCLECIARAKLAARCMSFYGTSHVCNEDSGHDGAHGCQCGITWEDSPLAVSATEPGGAQRPGRPS